MGLLSRCRGNFGKSVSRRGEDYYRRHAVKITAQHGMSLHARVRRGSSPSPYEVDLDWSYAEEGTMLASCSCPRFEDLGVCKHIVATLMAADAEDLGPEVPGRGPLVLELNDNGAVYELEEQRFTGPGSGSRTWAARQPAAAKARKKRPTKRQPALGSGNWRWFPSWSKPRRRGRSISSSGVPPGPDKSAMCSGSNPPGIGAGPAFRCGSGPSRRTALRENSRSPGCSPTKSPSSNPTRIGR